MFEYVFMQRGILVGILLGAIIPLVGVTVVLKRLSMIGDTCAYLSCRCRRRYDCRHQSCCWAIAACLGGRFGEEVHHHFKDQSRACSCN